MMSHDDKQIRDELIGLLGRASTVGGERPAAFTGYSRHVSRNFW
jgi:hypothetical protein